MSLQTGIGGGAAGSGGLSGNPGCHWDCFGGATCENGIVAVWHWGACPCEHCSQMSDCIKETATCSDACVRTSVALWESDCAYDDVACWVDVMCASPEGDIPDGSDASDTDASPADAGELDA